MSKSGRKPAGIAKAVNPPATANASWTEPHALHPAFVCLLLAAITLVVLWPVRGFNFVNYDDGVYVTDNPRVLGGLTWDNVGWAFTDLQQGFWHPLTWLSLMFDATLSASGAGVFHTTNLLLHTANTILLFLLFRRLTGAQWRSAVVAGLFALHPLHVESVAWVAERKDVLSTFFGLLALLCYVRYAQGLPRGENSEIRSSKSERSPKAEVRNPKSELQEPAWISRLSAFHFLAFRFCRSLHPLSSRWYALALAFFGCGLMSKTMVVTLPLVMLLLDYWPLNRMQNAECRMQKEKANERGARGEKAPNTKHQTPNFDGGMSLPNWKLAIGNWKLEIGDWKCLVWEKAPFLVLALAGGLVTVFAEQRVGALSFEQQRPLLARVGNALLGYGHYLQDTIWPHGLAVFYPWPKSISPWLSVGVGLGLVLVSAASLWQARRHPYVLVGWFWYLVTLLPVCGVVAVGIHSRADRYTYLPLVGVFVAVVWGGATLRRHLRLPRRAAWAVAGALLGVCGAATRVQLGYWEDSETLFTHALAVTRDNYVAYSNLGLYRYFHGQLDEAVKDFRRSLELRPNHATTLVNLGAALDLQGQREAAMECYRKALAAQPNHVGALNNVALMLAESGQTAAAAEKFRAVLQLDPQQVAARINLATALQKLGKTDEAIVCFQEALRAEPNDARSHSGLGRALAAKERLDEALEQCAEAVRLAPDYVPGHNNLGYVLARQGRAQEAVQAFRQALELEPGNAEAHFNLGCALAGLGQRDEAIRELNEACRLRPGYEEAKQKLRELGMSTPE